MEAEQIGIGNEVAFAGLFVNHHGKKRNEPIVRFGNICGIPSEPVSTKAGDIEAYLVESRSVGGLSGSPVLWTWESFGSLTTCVSTAGAERCSICSASSTLTLRCS
jgi:hypothetical protein